MTFKNINYFDLLYYIFADVGWNNSNINYRSKIIQNRVTQCYSFIKLYKDLSYIYAYVK